MDGWNSVHGSQEGHCGCSEGLQTGDLVVGCARGPWCMLKMVWLEESTETLLPSPGRMAWELKWAQAPSGVCTKPQCCVLCSDGHVLGNREGPPSDWPGKGRRFPERCSQGISRKAWRAQGGWESMDRRHHGETMVGNSELSCGNSYLPSIK